ncbi:MAG: glycoside hydrolase family 19 protein [Caulobacterales bacterium]|nr:glycoside hydrolase family 19 protein [Caulobacterales bacterium]
MHHESQGFARLSESLNYSVEGLLATFGRHRISEADCRALGRTATRKADKRAIANKVYGGEWGRKNLGNTEPNDGWDMRGSGFKMNTGRANITETGFTGEQLRTDVNAAADAAANFFVKHGCIPFARADDVEGLTKRINGGAIGLAERRTLTARAKHVMGLA